MISKTSATILKAALNEKKQQVLALEEKADYSPDHQALHDLRCRTAHQEGRYIGAKDGGNKSSIAEEKRKWGTLKFALRAQEKFYKEWLDFDFDKHDAAVDAIEAEIREIQRDLGPYKVREFIKGAA